MPNGELFEFREKANAEPRTAGVSPDRLAVGEGSISPSSSALSGAFRQSTDAQRPQRNGQTDSTVNAPDIGTVSQPGGSVKTSTDTDMSNQMGEDGDVLTLTADTAGKVSSHLMGKNWVDGETYERKLNAGAHLDELARVSKRDSAIKPDEGGAHGEMAQNGWVYRKAFFLDFDGNYYEVELSTALGPNGTTVYNVGKMTRRTFPAIYGSSAQGGAQLRKSSSSVARVAQKMPTVKNEIKTSVDTDNEQRLDDSR